MSDSYLVTNSQGAVTSYIGRYDGGELEIDIWELEEGK